MALKRNVTGLAIYVLLTPIAEAIEARGQSPVLMQVASASSRSPPSAAFFADEVTGSSTSDGISEAVRAGQRRTSISEIEAVHQAPHSRDAYAKKSTDSAEEFRLLKFDGLKLEGLKEVSSKVMSLVAEGARAAAESVAPTAMQKGRQPSPVTKVQKKAPSALSSLGQMRQAKVSTLQSNSRTGASSGGSSTEQSSREESSGTQRLQPQRLHSKPVAYDEATAEEEAQRRHEEETREEHAKMEDLMDEVRNRRSW